MTQIQPIVVSKDACQRRSGSAQLNRRSNLVQVKGDHSAKNYAAMPVVVTQQAAQMLATLNVTPITAHFLSRLDQPVPQPLMIAFSMIMADVGADRPAQHVLTKE